MLLFRVESYVILLSRSLKRLRAVFLDSRVVILYIFICSLLSHGEFWYLMVIAAKAAPSLAFPNHSFLFV